MHRDQIDVAQWNARVAQSGSGLPYALADYLDLVTGGNWSALVSDNYTSIFPLPYEIKMGLKMYLQPPFTQQLGLISEDHTTGLLAVFLDAIPNDFATLFLKGNECNTIHTHKSVRLNERTNYLLDLNPSYENIFSNFSKSLRKRIKKGSGYYEIEESKNVDDLVDFYQNEMQSKVGLNANQYSAARSLFEYVLSIGIGKIYLAKCEDNIEGALLVLQYQNRIVNLFGTSNGEGKKHFAMHLILNHIIRENSNRGCILDFEGSDLEGVKQFYESFGPERKVYLEFHIDRSPLWLKVVSRLKRFISK